MAPSDSDNKGNVKEQIEAHKKELKKKDSKKKSSKKVSQKETTDKKSLNQYLKSLLNLTGLMEESVDLSRNIVDNQKSMMTTVNRIADGISDLNHTLVAHFNSQAQTSVKTASLLEELADTSVFDSSPSEDNDAFVSMSENMADMLDDYYDSARGKQDKVIDEMDKKITDTVTRVVDDIEDFTDELSDFSNSPIQESEEKKQKAINDLHYDQLITSVMAIEDGITSIAANFIAQKNRKVGVSTSNQKKDKKDEKKGIISKMLGYLNPLNWFKGLGKMLWNGLKGAAVGITAVIWKVFKGLSKRVYKFFTGLIERGWSSTQKFFSKMWTKTKVFTGKIWESTKGFFAKIWDNIAGFVGKIGNRIGKFFEPFVSKIGKFFAPITNTLSRVFAPIARFLKPIMKFTGKMFSNPVFKFFGKLVKGVSKLGFKAVPVIGQIWMVIDTLWDFTKGFSSKGAADITGKAEETLTIWDKFKAGLSSAISGFLFGLIEPKTILGLIDSVGDHVSQVFSDIADMLPESWRKAGRDIMSFFDFSNKNSVLYKFWEGAKGLYDKVANFITPFVQSAWSSVKPIISDGLNMIPKTIIDTVNNIVSYVKESVPKIEGVWDSITGFTSSIYNNVSSFFTSVIDWFKDINILNNTVKAVTDFNNNLINKVKSILQSILDFIPDSVKKFISSKAVSVGDTMMTAWNAGKQFFSSEKEQPRRLSDGRLREQPTSNVRPIPQRLNTDTARMTDEQRVRPVKEQAKANNTNVIVNQNKGNNVKPIARNVNTGRSDIARSIGRGSQFSFGG